MDPDHQYRVLDWIELRDRAVDERADLDVERLARFGRAFQQCLEVLAVRIGKAVVLRVLVEKLGIALQ